MDNLTTMLVSVTVVLVACTTILGQEISYFESFENGIPDYFVPSRPDSLSLSPWHYKHGENSLRWNWQAGEELIIHHGIGDVERRGEFGTRASFSVWLYTEEPIASELLFEFREGETVTGSFRFPLHLTGWRQGRPFYHAFPEGQPTSEVDNIRIVAATDTPEGTVFLDFIKYNTLTYGWHQVIPEKEAQWQRPTPDDQRFSLPEQVSDEELAAIRKLIGPDEGPGIGQAQVDNICEQIEALGIVRDEHGVRGPGIDGHYQFFASAREAAAAGARPSSAYWPDEHGPGWEDMQTPAAMSSLAQHAASAYRASNDAEQRKRLADAYLLLADHLHDQAFQAGSGFQWNWWVGGAWAHSVFLMRDVLAQTGRLGPHVDYLLHAWGGGELFQEGAPPSHMDFYNLWAPSLLRQCLLQVEPAEQVRWLNAFKSMLERSILQPTSAFKIDGSAYHHSAHYPSYANGAHRSLSTLILQMRGTPWSISPEVHERVRRAIIAQRIFCNTIDVPTALQGRSTMRAIQMAAPALGTLALAGTPDGLDEVDRELAAAYLRVVPDAADEEPYRDLDIAPEPHPEGTFVMPYAGLLSHRRDDWLVSLRGQSKYVWASEREDHHNRFGVFQSLGQLEVLAGGDPVNASDSGRQQAGWDWARFEGTTVPHLPQPRLAEAWPGSVTYSPETFMGGLSHRGSQGVFGMILNQSVRPDINFSGRKSWFFVDNQIICLGSDIFCDESEHPMQTTVCQKGLVPNDEGQLPAIMIDGDEVTAFPDEQELDPAHPHWLIDAYQVGYHLPAGQMTSVVRRHQASRGGWDNEDTEGDMLTAWIDHGIAPTDAAYEYMMVVRATPDMMQSLSALPPYQVIQRDQNAHIIRHTATGLWGCVLFAEQELAAHTSDGDTLPVRSVDRACLVMAETADDGQLHLSIADPDLNLVGGVNEARTIQITLRGQWRLLEARATVCAWELEGAADKAKVVAADADETVLEIICEHGASYDLTLARG